MLFNWNNCSKNINSTSFFASFIHLFDIPDHDLHHIQDPPLFFGRQPFYLFRQLRRPCLTGIVDDIHKDLVGGSAALITGKPHLMSCVESLIVEYGVTKFYVGNQGSFDRMAKSVLQTLQKKHPYIIYYIVLVYFSSQKEEMDDMATIYPDGLETVPRRFAISHRNRRMLRQADYVVGYITHSWGGAAHFFAQARASGKAGNQSGRGTVLLIPTFNANHPQHVKPEATLFRFSCCGQFAEIITDNLLRQLSRRMIHATYSPLLFPFYQIQQWLADLPNPVFQPDDQPVLFQSPKHSGGLRLGMPGMSDNPILAA